MCPLAMDVICRIGEINSRGIIYFGSNGAASNKSNISGNGGRSQWTRCEGVGLALTFFLYDRTKRIIYRRTDNYWDINVLEETTTRKT